ncbi:Ger(x)C family spore germination protein [Paenibacillus sp. GCM10027626]|uniref:Ger(x)C family spore germination protein n=1 Tax=Paenibacillus sp. GCM10027626 TaxID=3273411 RepID=UPI00364326E0
MRKMIATAIVFAPVLLLAGCWDRTELNDLALVTAVAIDKPEGQGVELSVQIMIPRKIGGGTMGGGTSSSEGKQTLVRSETGTNIADALSKLQRIVPRKLFWGQCKVFIFGESMAKEGIQESMDFLVRHPQPRERAYMYVSKGKAAAALEVSPPLERSSGEVLRELSDLQIGIQVTMKELNKMLTGESQAATLPYVHILPPEKGSKETQTIPYIYGSAIFKKDKMIQRITEKTTRGVMWLRNEIKEYTVTFQHENEKGEKGAISLKPIKAKVKLIPRIDKEKWKMVVKVWTEGDMVQNGTKMNPLHPELISKLEQSFQKDVKERIELALRVVQQELKVDIFNFGREFHRKYPAQWRKTKERWEELFPQVEVTTIIDAHIRRPGLIGPPGGLPKEEVEKQ